jgi:superfamily II DNA or RNA helicase
LGFLLRPYQEELITAARSELLAGERSVLMVAPTGAGKTALAAFMLGTASARGKRCWFLVHRRELVTQSSRTFDKVGIDHGIVSAGFAASPKSLVQICSVQTLIKRMATVPAPDMIVWDEAHHIASESWAKIFSMFPSAIHIGLTATPCRLDGRGLGDWFGVMVQGPTTKSLIGGGFLSPYRYFAPSNPDMDGVKSRGGDYIGSEVADKMDKPSVTGDAIKHYRRLCNGARAIVFAANIQHSKNVVAQFSSAGYPAAHVDGTTERTERDKILRDFELGRILIVSNVDLFGEGFDLPAIEAAILLRPTQSTGLFLQQVGRSLRMSEGKTQAVILDHAGNVFRHGLPDEIREWSLDAKPKTKREKAEKKSIKQCPNCYGAHEAELRICPCCGHEYIVEARKLELRDGELAEVSPEEISKLRRKEQASAKSIDDLITLATARRYKNPRAWANHVYHARHRRFG